MNRVVLGGGISGLSAAYYLKKRFPHDHIVILEGSNRVGGWIRSIRYPEGIIFEKGPRTIRPRGAKASNTLQLIEELGLEREIRPIPSSHPAASNRMIYVNGKLHSLPSSVWGIFRTVPPFSKPLIRCILHDLIAPRKKVVEGDESIYSFVSRRFGQEAADYAISPLICGICAGDAKEISVKFLMEDHFRNEQKYGTVARGVIQNIIDKLKDDSPRTKLSRLNERVISEGWSLYSFKDGLEVLPSTLKSVNEKNGVEIRLGTTCKTIKVTDRLAVVETNQGTFPANTVISTLPAPVLGKALTGDHSLLTKLLLRIPAVTVAVVNVLYKSKFLHKEGFGFLVPPKEQVPILGVIFDSCCYPVHDKTVLTIMMGGHWYNKYFGDNPSEQFLVDTALKKVEEILKITETPSLLNVDILKDCIPQYRVGHSDILFDINNYLKYNKLQHKLLLCGSSYEGVGINDVIYSAKKAVDKL